MPKRICAITLTKDERTIVAGDKFGDVYSLPLFPSKDDPLKTANAGHQDSVPDFKPSASELTVHTKGNLEALRQQQLQKNFKPKKEGIAFEHTLLLGHVSLLTDLAIAEVEEGAGRRQYILTADRDEHIRVSRGISQSHVIENYCLGHTDFVSKLCILPWQTSTLVAGSGEPSLKVYDWRRGLCSTDLLALDGTLDRIKDCVKTEGLERSTDNLAISGIWASPINKSRGFVLVALEGLPLLLSYICDDDVFTKAQIIPLSGNALDVVVAEAGNLIVVSIDTVHQPCSMKTRRRELLDQGEAIVCFTLPGGGRDQVMNEPSVLGEDGEVLPLWTQSSLPAIDKALADEPSTADIEPAEGGKQYKSQRGYSKLGEFLYGLENLRKHKGHEDHGDVEAEEEPEPEVGVTEAAGDEDLMRSK
jgi:tRNA (guanine-N(7)-)-methyltransferase subunit TRM82